MDTRQLQNNSFAEGIISDLHPLTTPNTCLIDAINATILTYNGNEFLLQNEQGNYKLEHCKLPSNFMPVGTTEYGDTLYIASYNPITKETEIGTYPSPRTIFSTKDRDQKVTFVPLVNGNVGIKNYTDLIKNAKLQIYALSDDMENFKLNPGDKFVILLGDEDGFPYQTIGYHVLTDNKELIPIDIPLNEGYIWPLGSHVDDEDFKNVFWEVPGWLAGKYRLAVMDQFYLNVRSVTLPEFVVGENFDVTDIQINTQMEVSDDLFRNNPRPNANTLRDLKVEYKAYLKTGRAISSNIGSLSEHHYNDDMDIYYNNWAFNVNNVSINDIIVVEAVPYVEYSGSKIYYDQFRTMVEINLSSINDARDINAANVVYKYIADEDSLTLTFNIEGPFVNNSLIDTYLEIYQIYSGSPVRIYNQKQIDVNLLGTNTFDIPWSIDKMEDMYILSIVFRENSNIIKRVNKLMIVSKTFNDFYNTYQNFSEIRLEQWVDKYKNYLSIDSSNFEFVSPSPIPGNTWLPPTGIGKWPNNIVIDASKPNNQKLTGSGWWTQSLASTLVTPTYRYGAMYNVGGKLTTITSRLEGNLWDDIEDNSTFEYTVEGEDSSQTTDYNFIEGTSTIIPINKFFGREVINKYRSLGSKTIYVGTKWYPFAQTKTGVPYSFLNVSGLKYTGDGLAQHYMYSSPTGKYTYSGTNLSFTGGLNGAPRLFDRKRGTVVQMGQRDGQTDALRGKISEAVGGNNIALLTIDVESDHEHKRIASSAYWVGQLDGNQGDMPTGPDGPFIYTVFRGTDVSNGPIVIPFQVAGGQEIGMTAPSSYNGQNGSGTISSALAVALDKFKWAFYVYTNGSTKNVTFVSPEASFLLEELLTLLNTIIHVNMTDIDYIGRSLLDGDGTLYNYICNSIEPSIRESGENSNYVTRIDTVNLLRSSGNGEISFDMKVGEEFQYSVNVDGSEEIVDEFINFINGSQQGEVQDAINKEVERAEQGETGGKFYFDQYGNPNPAYIINDDQVLYYTRFLDFFKFSNVGTLYFDTSRAETSSNALGFNGAQNNSVRVDLTYTPTKDGPFIPV